jgi:hypothetical protein
VIDRSAEPSGPAITVVATDPLAPTINKKATKLRQAPSVSHRPVEPSLAYPPWRSIVAVGSGRVRPRRPRPSVPGD